MLANIESAAEETILIGMEPADLSFGEGLSPVVEAEALALIEVLRKKDLDKIPKHESTL